MEEKPILIQGAIDIELDYLINIIKEREEVEIGTYKYYKGLIDGYPVVVSKTKIGQTNAGAATSIAILKYSPLLIINQGTAGGHGRIIHKGDIVIGKDYINLTAFQSIPLDGIIIVSTPQDLVSLIVKKAINMAKMMNIPIIGIIENMSYLTCPKCNEKIYLFGKSKLETYAKENNLKILGRLPLISETSVKIDNGEAVNVEINEFDEIVNKIMEEEK